MKILIFAMLVILLAGCNSSDDPATSNTELNLDKDVEAHNLDYYLENPDETDVQLKLCEEVPPQARSETLQGNCDYAGAALRLR